MRAARPYADELTRALGAVLQDASLKHPMLTGVENPRRSAILLITSDRGLAGGYNANAIKRANVLASELESEGREVVRYVIGRKGTAYYNFRRIELAGSWTGFSEQPSFADIRELTETLGFALSATSEGEHNGEPGVDELYVIYTQFTNSVTQTAVSELVSPVKDSVEKRQEDDDSEEQSEESEGGLPRRLRVRAGRGAAARSAAAPLHQRADLLRAARVGGVRVGRAAAGDEVGERQRDRAHQDLHAAGQPGPPGGDHPGNQRDRRRRRRPRGSRSRGLTR